MAAIKNNYMNILGSSVIIMTRLRAGQPGLDSRQGGYLFSRRNPVQTSSGAHPASYPMCNGGKAAEA
jgi:hypothetical protein